MKRFCFLFFAMALLSFVQGVAQDEGPRKPVVYVDYFYRDTIVNPVYADIVRDCVVTNLKGIGRVDFVDVDSIEVLRGAREKCERGWLTDEEIKNRFNQMSKGGAVYLIQGRIDNIAISETELSDGSKDYAAILTFTLKIVDVNKGILLQAETFNMGGGLLDPQGSTIEDAIINACNHSRKKIVRFIEANFKIVGKILEIDKVEDGKVKTLYINFGWGDDVVRGDNFEVRKLRTIAGRSSSSIVGRLSVEAVEGEHRSLAKVRSGGDEIKKYLDSGEDIVVIGFDRSLRMVDYF